MSRHVLVRGLFHLALIFTSIHAALDIDCDMNSSNFSDCNWDYQQGFKLTPSYDDTGKIIDTHALRTTVLELQFSFVWFAL